MNRAEYVYHVRAREPLFVALACALALLSVVTVWSEVTFFAQRPVLSVWALLLGLGGLSDAALQILAFCVVFFMTFAAYNTLFRLEVMSWYRLVPGGLSDPNSLLFSAAYLARLFYPLCYNVLYVVHYANEQMTGGTAFVGFMGIIDQVPLFGHWYFQLVFPFSVVIVVFLVAADVHKRILSCFTDVFEQEEDFEHASLAEGRQLLLQERQARLAPSPATTDARRVVPTPGVRLRVGMRATSTPGAAAVSDDERSDAELFRQPAAAPASSLWASVWGRLRGAAPPPPPPAERV